MGGFPSSGMGLGQPKKFLTNRTLKSLHLGRRFFIARTKKSVPSKDWAFGGRSVAILSRNWDSSEKEKPTSSPLIDPRKLKKGQKPFN